MENNQNTNERNAKAVTTRDITYKNSVASIPCALEVTYYNEMVRLSFIPPLPESSRGEKRLYDYDHPIITYLVRKKCQELFDAYKDVIIPALKNKEQKFVSVLVGETMNHIGISTGVSSSTDGECHPCIILVRGIDDNTKKSNDVILYEFVKGEYHVDYNPITGTEKEVIITDSELEMFMSDLQTFKEAMSKSYVHSSRLVDRSYKDMMADILKGVGEKMGIQNQTSYGGKGNSNYNASSLGFGSIFNTSSPDDATVNSISDASQLADALG